MRPIPVYEQNLYSADAIRDPLPHYARLRELGPVVRLKAHKVYALPRHAECKQVLLDDKTFISGDGVALNPVSNRLGRGTTLNSDGTEHAQRRAMVAHRLTPRALTSMRETVQAAAASVVTAAVARENIDAVKDLAQALPLSVVPDLVGWPQESRDHLLRWAGATFDLLGPFNGRARGSALSSLGMLRFARRVVHHRTALPGSMGAELLGAVDGGRLSEAECRALMIDYLAPSLDTTISAISGAVHLLATHPDQWALLKADRTLVPNAVNEVVRLTSPVRAFSRKAKQDTEIAGHPIRAGERVLVLYASANRDERVWDDPDRFDVTRQTVQQLGFGHGAHGCAGQGLARMETQAILQNLLDAVERIELTGKPEWALNNIIRSYRSVPVRLVPVDGPTQEEPTP